jgi:predicted nucleic acid-binding protein
MALIAVALDSSPLGLVTQKTGKSPVGDACRAWMENLLVQGVRVYVPEVADYEVRRELVRAGKINSVRELDRLKSALNFLPISSAAMLLAADLWATSRPEAERYPVYYTNTRYI